MTRDEFKGKVNNLSCHLYYPVLNDLHDIDDNDAEQRLQIEQQAQQIAGLREVLKGWQSLFRRAVSIAGGLTNYVEDRPELHHAERALELLEEQAQQALKEVS